MEKSNRNKSQTPIKSQKPQEQILNKQSQKILFNIFKSICQHEAHIETLRQQLCADTKFEPYMAFTRIDRD